MKDFSIGCRRCRFFYKKRSYKTFKIDFLNFFWYQLVVGRSYFVFEIRSKERYRQQLPWTEPDGVHRGPLKLNVWVSANPQRKEHFYAADASSTRCDRETE